MCIITKITRKSQSNNNNASSNIDDSDPLSDDEIECNNYINDPNECKMTPGV